MKIYHLPLLLLSVLIGTAGCGGTQQSGTQQPGTQQPGTQQLGEPGATDQPPVSGNAFPPADQPPAQQPSGQDQSNPFPSSGASLSEPQRPSQDNVTSPPRFEAAPAGSPVEVNSSQGTSAGPVLPDLGGGRFSSSTTQDEFGADAEREAESEFSFPRASDAEGNGFNVIE